MNKLSNEEMNQIIHHLPDFPWQKDYSLKGQTYFKIGGPAQLYVELNSAEKIAELYQYVTQNQIKLIILGGMSNVLIADEGISGIVLKIKNEELKIKKTETTGQVLAGAGLKTALLVKKTMDESLVGLEKFLGVPGELGGAIYNNAHYLNEYIGDFVTRVQVINDRGQIIWLSRDECDFAYDSSRFQKTKEIIFEIEFSLQIGDHKSSLEKMKGAAKYRADTQPLGVPSSGCIFQNIPNNDHLRTLFPQFKDRELVPTGFLIDQAGLKNFKEGDIKVSDKHAAFFVNEGKGTAKDVLQLIKSVKAIVKEKFGVELKEEVFYLQ